MTEEFEKELTNIAHDAANKLNLVKYSLNLNLNALKGDGFMGEFYRVSIIDEETDITHHLAVKKAPKEQHRRDETYVEFAYKNEIHFYLQICHTFNQFEEDHQVPKLFIQSVPGYVTSVSDIGKEMIVLEDITKDGFVLREKDLLLDDAHAELIFKTYGHFHAIGFCLKEKKPEEFAKLTKPLVPIWRKRMTEKYRMVDFLNSCIKEALESLNPVEDALVVEKTKKYADKTKEIFLESLDYKGDYFGIVHGDCWSNNMMFKYKDSNTFSQLDDVKLLDFQLVNVGTPVYDLSYFFYTGGSKELFDKLDHYLDVYHQSFSTVAKNLDCDPDKLLPRQVLDEDWKRYSKFGLLLSIVLVRNKLINKKNMLKIIKNMEQNVEVNNDRNDTWMKDMYDEDLYKKRVRDILVHMHEIDAL